MSHNSKRLAWVDFETTGFTDLLNQAVYSHKVLELALVITDFDLQLIDRLNLVIHHDLSDVLPLCDDVVLKMHSANGLFDEVSQSTTSLREAEIQAIAMLKKHGVGPTECQSPISGNGIHFDRNFMAVHMPKLHDQFRYRNLDISSVKEFINTIMPGMEPIKKLAHRAMADVEETLAEARYYRALIEPALMAEKRRRDLDECLEGCK